MTDEEAFVAAIVACKEDDTSRLVYADWLEENADTVECDVCNTDEDYALPRTGHCWRCLGTGRVSDGRRERAEFIRVQVELARYGNCQCGMTGRKPLDGGSFCCPKCGNLRRRERELLQIAARDENKPGAPFLIAIDGELVGQKLPQWCYKFSRGFVSSLTCTWDAWREHAAAILKRQPIERVCSTTPAEIKSPMEEILIAVGMRLDNQPDGYRITSLGRSISRIVFRAWPRIEFELPSASPQNLPRTRDHRYASA